MTREAIFLDIEEKVNSSYSKLAGYISNLGIPAFIEAYITIMEDIKDKLELMRKVDIPDDDLVELQKQITNIYNDFNEKWEQFVNSDEPITPDRLNTKRILGDSREK